MKISKNSWHYRLQNMLEFSIPENLCAYFWKTMLALGVFSLVIVTASFVLGMLTYPIWQIWVDAQEGFIVIVGAVYFVVGVIAVLVVRSNRDLMNAEWNKEIPLPHVSVPKVKTPKRISLLWEFIKAKKQKVCPRLEFE